MVTLVLVAMIVYKPKRLSQTEHLDKIAEEHLTNPVSTSEIERQLLVKKYGAKNYLRGAYGEDMVWSILKSIPSIYSFHNVKLPGYKQNIDHVVVCEKGVFVLETKNYRNRMGINKYGWYYESGKRKFQKHISSPFGQVMTNVFRLREYLQNKLPSEYKNKLYIDKIVVIANTFDWSTKPDGVIIVNLKGLEIFFDECKFMEATEKTMLIKDYLEGVSFD